MNLISLDFEYNRTNEENLNVLCVALKSDSIEDVIDLRSPIGRVRFKKLMKYLKNENPTLLSYSVEAESSALISLGIDPFEFDWIDVYLEYRQLLNQNDKYCYGKQLIDGKEKTTRKPRGKFEKRRSEEDDEDASKPSFSLASACYKMLDLKIDTDHKNEMREIIINGTVEQIDQNFKSIMEYCQSDVIHLKPLFSAIERAIVKEGIPRYSLSASMKNRANYAILSAYMTRRGYPIDLEAASIFSSSVPEILAELKHDINEKTKEALGFQLFRFPEKKILANGKVIEYASKQGTMDKKAMQEWIKPRYKNWPSEDKSDMPSLKSELVAHFSGARHDYSIDPIDQLYRFLRTKQSLNGFMVERKGNSFWEYVGSDGRVRPYFNIYGSQTSRSQPKATSFIPLKSAWMRYLIQPKEGKMILGLDYGSQEFLIAAMLSNDPVMISSYQSGDPYLDFAIRSKQAPKDATRKSHEKVRDRCKSSVLGIIFQMGADSLAKKTSKEMKENYTKEQAQKQIDLFKETYSDLEAWNRRNLREYESDGYLSLKDGWVMFSDNDNWRSTVNFPVQGHGAVVMREAVKRCHENKIDIIMTLHDALYAELDLNDWGTASLFAKCMSEAFMSVLGDGKEVKREILQYPCFIRLDGVCWGYGIQDNVKGIPYRVRDINLTAPIKVSERYIDQRSIEDFNKFKKYMSKDSIF